MSYESIIVDDEDENEDYFSEVAEANVSSNPVQLNRFDFSEARQKIEDLLTQLKLVQESDTMRSIYDDFRLVCVEESKSISDLQKRLVVQQKILQVAIKIMKQQTTPWWRKVFKQWF